jgi:hypothetical protein
MKVKTDLKAGAVVFGVSAGGDAIGGNGGAGGLATGGTAGAVTVTLPTT